jgi:hypothetical protein
VIGMFAFVFARMERSLGRAHVARFVSLLGPVSIGAATDRSSSPLDRGSGHQAEYGRLRKPARALPATASTAQTG